MGEHNYEDVWKYALDQLHEEFKNAGRETEFKLWFNMTYVEDTLTTITVSVPSEFLWQSMLKKGNVQLVTKKIEELTGQINLNIQHIVNNQSIFSTSNSVPESENIINFRQEIKTEIYQEQPVQKIQEPVKIQFQEKQIRKHPQLFEKYTFDTFIPGSNSDYAYNAAIAAAKNPGKTYNPILLYGGVGLGKTHLMEAIGN